MKKYFKNYFWLILIGTTLSCVETDLDNLSNPNASAVLALPDDYVSVLDGAAYSFWDALHKDDPYMSLEVAADHGSSSWGNFGMRALGTVSAPYGLGDHSAIDNTVTASQTGFLEDPYNGLYGAISSANDVISSLQTNKSIEDDERNQVLAYGLFLRGIGYGYLSLLYDQALITDEDSDLLAFTFADFVGYKAILTQAKNDLDASIVAAGDAKAISIKGFNGLTINKATLIELANGYVAKFLIHGARDAKETTAVDWAMVKDYAMKGPITFDLAPIGDGGTLWWHAFFRLTNDGWIRVDQKIINMVNTASPFPYPKAGYAPDSIAVGAADYRFNEKNPNTKFSYAGPAPFNANRGVYFNSFWRFSEYDEYRKDGLTAAMPSFEARENQLNLAEALIRTSSSGAAAIINATRVTNGKKDAATDADTDLLDKLFYERYLEAYEGPGNPFFDRRRTDDLGNKQFKQLPIPAQELNAWSTPLYTFGGE